jgi:hypothetical protein
LVSVCFGRLRRFSLSRCKLHIATTDCDPDLHTTADIIPDGDSDVYSNPDPITDLDFHCHSNRNVHVDPDQYLYAYCDEHPNCYTNPLATGRERAGYL